MHTSRNYVTNYIHMSFTSSCLDGNCLKGFEIHSPMDVNESLCLVIQSLVSKACDWIHSAEACLQLLVVSNACDWTSHDWVDQTMSYQLIQTTSFAMHPRLVEYTPLKLSSGYTVASCCFLLNDDVTDDVIILTLPLVSSSADCDDITADVIIADPSFSLLQRLLAQQLISLHLLNSNHLLIPVVLHCYVCCCLVQHCSSAVNGFLNSDCQQIRQQYL
ncbi:pentatricopeptide repeat-containing protein [Dorcoceras hygrometricum]|uniref:Pentatricopeptide repeat-containing protein n=1 Tax=Dorcoceras hygrometricum TaxID=472368 RepID=A0A2Z7AP37_9LAMI|nr:pentatricopeptide repeat-containing protein [Dorcoceras hygrometricum]